MEIERRIEPLGNLGLIRELQYPFQKSSVRIIGLTFGGLMWYFREVGKPTRKKDIVDFFFRRFKEPYDFKSRRRRNRFVLESHKELVPFCSLWYEMVQEIGEECMDRFSTTVDNFYVGDKVSLKIEPLGLEIKSYQNYSGELVEGVFFPRSNRQLVVNYLGKEESIMLREAYIAYLVSEDFKRLGNMDESEIRSRIPRLKSVTELENLEKSRESFHLFSEKGLSRFFPKYESIGYFFTGLFIFNLLWEKRQVDDLYYDEVLGMGNQEQP